MSDFNAPRSKITGSVTAKRNGFGLEALLKEGDTVRLTGTGQDGTKYIKIGFDVELRLDPQTAAALKAIL